MIEKWADLKQLITYSKGGILSKELIRTNKNNVTLFCMAEGTELTEHTSTKEGIVFVLEGEGEFVLEGEKIEMLPAVMIYLKKNAVHSLKAGKNTSFLLALTP